jgi:hypothetical protein
VLLIGSQLTFGDELLISVEDGMRIALDAIRARSSASIA